MRMRMLTTRHPGRGLLLLALLVAVVALIVAGCGSSDDNSSDSGGSAAKETATAAPAAPTDAPDPQPAVEPRSGGSGTPIKIAIMSECKGAFGAFDNQNMAGAVAALSQFAGATPKDKNNPKAGFTGGAIGDHP